MAYVYSQAFIVSYCNSFSELKKDTFPGKEKFIDLIFPVDHIVKSGEAIGGAALIKIAGGKGANQAAALAKAGMEADPLQRRSVYGPVETVEFLFLQ